MENKAFELVRQDRTEEAQSLLFSSQYKTQKQVYAGGVSDHRQSRWLEEGP